MKAATILIVDDHPTNVKLARYVLEGEGYALLQARDAVEARKVLTTAQPDLILMDIQLPGMDGLTLTRELKAHPLYRHIRIIALTSFAMKGDDLKAREAGCDGYITKPINTTIFPTQIAAVLWAQSDRSAREAPP